ncbi:MAG: Gldg family protein [Planctomycetes bacterium]|nr:Gldg family protein [Planctomycetota bacterium]
MNRSFNALLAIVILIALFLGINILVGQGVRRARVDLTQDKLFTLSDGARNIARNSDDTITLTYYFSEKSVAGVEPYNTYGKRVRELLEEFSRQSNGKVLLQVVDPAPYSEDEDRATAAGLVPLQGRDPIFMGLVGKNTTDGVQVIPALDPSEERFLEYNVSKLIYQLSNPKKKAVGLISPLNIAGGFVLNPQTQRPEQKRPSQVITELRQLYEVRELGVDSTEIPADIEVLLLVHPKDFKDQTLYAIDQFVLRGGRLIALVDPYCETDIPMNARNQMEAMLAPKASNLNKLLNAWGVEIVDSRFIGDLKRAVNVNQPGQREAVPYIGWVDMRMDKEKPADSNLVSGDLITGNLNRIVFATAGSIQDKPGRGEGSWVTVTPLVQSTDEAMLIDTAKIGMMPDPKKLIAEYVPGKSRLTIAARLTGPVKTAFPAGKPAATPDPNNPVEKKEEPTTQPALTESKSPINVVLIADCDFIDDRFYVQEDRLFGQIPVMRKFSDNADFVSNTVDNLGGSQDLISIRARGEYARPFTRVRDMLATAQTKYRAEEDALQQKVEQAKSKIEEIQRARPDQKDGAVILTAEQQATIKKLREDIAETNKQLRNVKFNLSKDVEQLGTNLKIINIGLVPAIVALFAVGIGWYRVSRRRVKISE